MSDTKTPQPGDIWTFKIPGKQRRTKTVGQVVMKTFVVERGTFENGWKDKTENLPYVHWERANKGRYTGITVRRLMEFGRCVSRKAERDAHFNELVKKGRLRKAQEQKEQS